MNIIVDTCVWSLALRRKTAGPIPPVVIELQSLVLDGRVQMIGAIRQELLSGIKPGQQFKKLEAHLRSFPDLPSTTEDHVLAAKYFNMCRTKGVQGSNTDFLICAMAVNHKLPIFTSDEDFSYFAKHLPVTLHSID